MFQVILGLVGTVLSAEETNKEADNVADSSVTSYSTVVIHHPPPKNKKDGLKEGEEGGRSQAYFKVKRLRASTVAPNTNGQQNGDFRAHNEQNGQEKQKSEFRPSPPESNGAQNHRDAKADTSNFRPSQYLPESEVRVSFPGSNDQSGEGARHTEYYQSKDHDEYRRNKYAGGQGDGGSTKWRTQYRLKPSHSEDSRRPKQDMQFHREVFINHDYRPKNEKSAKPHPQKQEYSYDTSNIIPAIPVEVANPFQGFSEGVEQRLRPIPPPGMSEELIETLLSQQPQTFDAEPKAVLAESKKKSKSPTFKVGYSIGFGNNAGDDIIMGKPKDIRLHVNGRNSIWKTLPQGVEMSQELDSKKPMALKLEDNSQRATANVLKNDVYYVQNFKPDTSIPTAGRTSFNHAKALTNANGFDFSNAMEDPKWLKHPRALIHNHRPQQHQQQSETQQTVQQPQFDMSSIYQSLGYSPPLPVLLPGGPRGEGTMVHAIVIPIEQLPGLDFNWGNYAQVRNGKAFRGIKCLG